MILCYLFMAPVVLATLLFDLLPVLPSLYWSFTEWGFLYEPTWIGLENYRTIFVAPQGDAIRRTVGATLIYAVGSTVATTVVGLLLAVLVNQRLRGVGLFRTLYYLPVITSLVAATFAWQYIFHQRSGIVNALLRMGGLPPVPWGSDANWFMVGMIIITVWHQMGFIMVLFLAGLQAIPAVFTEAAAVDGAGPLQSFRTITLPLLTPTLFFVVVISLINNFQQFELLYILSTGPPIDLYVYRLWATAFLSYQDGLASAMAVLLFLFLAAMTFVQWKLQSRWVFYE
jgi:multiple sugar transport system permease protein